MGKGEVKIVGNLKRIDDDWISFVLGLVIITLGILGLLPGLPW